MPGTGAPTDQAGGSVPVREQAQPTELIVQKSEAMLGLIMNSNGIMKYPPWPQWGPQELRTIIIRLAPS